MSNITIKRASELLRGVFEILWNKSEGLTAREVMTRIPQAVRLSDNELRYSANSSIPSYEKNVRIATIPIAQAGWLKKNERGLWYITQDGYDACGRFSNVQGFYQEALRLYAERRREIPENIMTLEMAQEAAWAQIKKYLCNLNPNVFQIMLTELLRAMKYYPSWMAPPEKQRGKIDLIAYTDPIGVKGQRILVQVKHKGQVVTLEGIKSFVSVLNPDDFGMIVSMGGFTSDALQELGTVQRLTALDAISFFNFWELYYSELNGEVRRHLPLKAINFLAGIE